MAKFNIGEAFLQVVASVENIHKPIAAEVAKIKDIQIDVTPNMEGFREKVAAATAGLSDVDVNVKPDTTGFREKVKATVAGIGSMDVPVSPNVDTTRANAQVGAFATELRAKLEAATKALGDIHMTADSTDVERKIASIRAELATIQNQRIGVDIDAAAALAKIKSLEAELAALGARSPNIQVKVDVDAARANLQALATETESLISKFQNANLGSTMFAGIGAAIPPLLTSIGQLSGALGLIPAVATGVGTALASVVVGSQGLGDAFKAQAAAEQAAAAAAQSDAPAQQAVAAANQAATASGQQNIAGLQQQVTAGAAHVASLKAQQAAGADVTTELKAAQVTQSQNVAALKQAQSAATGNVGALGSYKTAQQTANQAVAESEAAHKKAKEAADAYAASLQNLAPSAREFVSAVVQLKPAFDQLRLDVQQQLFKGIGDQLTSMGSSVLPVIKQGLTDMGSAVNNVVTQVLQFTQQQSSLSAWQEIFQNVAAAANNLAGAVKPILQIITDVTQVGSELLPGLAKGFADAAQRAADFVSKAKDTGQLKQWIQTGIDAVKKLWQSFKDVVAIIADLTASPGFGPSFLDALNAVTGSIRWLIENVPGLTTAVKLFFDAWLIAKVVQGLTNMVTTIGSVSTAINGAITALKRWVTGNEEAAVASEAAAGRAKAAWIAAGKAIGVAALAVGADAILPQAPAGSSNPLNKARDELHQFAEAIKDPQAALENLFDEFSHFGDQFDFQNSPIMHLGENIASQFATLPGKIQGVFSGIASAAQGAWGGITGAATGAISGIQSAWSALTGFFSGLWQGIVSAAQGAWQGLVSFLNGIPGQIQSAWGTVSGFFTGLWQGIVSAAQSAWQGLVSFLSGLPAQIQSAWDTVSGFFSGLWQGIVSEAQGIWQGLVGTVQSVAQQIVGAFQAIPGQMGQIGQDIVQGIGQAIQSGWTWLQNLVSQLAQQLFTAAKSALGIASPSKKFAYVGHNIGLGLAQGIDASRVYAQRAMAQLNSDVNRAMTGPNINVTSQTGSAGQGYVPRSVAMTGGSVHDRRGSSSDQHAWDWIEQTLRRHGNRGGGRPAPPPPPQQLLQTVGQPDTAAFELGSTVGLSGSALPITPSMLSTMHQVTPAIPTPPSTGNGGSTGGRGRPRDVHITSSSPLINEFLRMLRSEIRKQGGDVQAVLGV